jgi:hypothetical protein
MVFILKKKKKKKNPNPPSGRPNALFDLVQLARAARDSDPGFAALLASFRAADLDTRAGDIAFACCLFFFFSFFFIFFFFHYPEIYTSINRTDLACIFMGIWAVRLTWQRLLLRRMRC